MPIARGSAVTTLACALLLAGRPAVGTLAAEPAGPEPATISISGHAELHVPADLADLSFAVSVRHADLATARKRQAERAGRVLAVLHAAGVADKDL